LPAVSSKARKAIRRTVRQWALHRRSDKALDDLARMFNPFIQGWINGDVPIDVEIGEAGVTELRA